MRFVKRRLLRFPMDLVDGFEALAFGDGEPGERTRDLLAEECEAILTRLVDNVAGNVVLRERQAYHRVFALVLVVGFREHVQHDGEEEAEQNVVADE